eukprot:Awhi_evm1s2231
MLLGVNFALRCEKIQTSTAERKLPDVSTTSDPREVMKIDAQHYESLTNEAKAEADSQEMRELPNI